MKLMKNREQLKQVIDYLSYHNLMQNSELIYSSTWSKSGLFVSLVGLVKSNIHRVFNGGYEKCV